VGPNHVMTALNSQVRIQNRNGTALSTVSLNSFWAPLGGSPDAFDPHVIYDPYNNRWIIAAAANGPPSANPSAILVGVSQTSDPTGSWFLYQAAADTAAVKWADYPTLGFNTNWIIVSANMFPISGSGSTTVNLFVFSKTNLYAHGSGVHRVMSDNSGVTFTLVPSVTLDNKLTTEYLIEDYDYSSGISAGKLRISTITGPVGAEVLNVGIAVTATTNRWGSYFGPGNFLPQKGSTTGIDAGDSRILSNVYRNGSLWASHTAFLPAGGSPHRTAAQWWQIAPAGTVQQFGRIQDTGGTNFYAYPTIAVNSRNDTLLGYSRFATNQFASCNYSLRYATDAANTFRGDVVYKAGKASYVSLDSGGANRWGDYSSTVVDPVNDLTMWTIQEYAENTSPNTWSTWWARVDMAPTLVYARQRTNLVLSWTGSYFLQFSTNVVGTYIDVPGATSPYTNNFSLRFFRLRN
jgi:hypothetical protein